MPAETLKQYLDDQQVKYITIKHSKAYTAMEVAESAHVPGKELAKTVMVKIGPEMAMVVVPAPNQVNLDHLKESVGTDDVEIAHEREFKDKFPDCEVGAMPPFGNLYNMKVFVSQALREDEEITFNAGSHTELFRLAYADFERLVEPILIAD